jgi:hypothetical protein
VGDAQQQLSVLRRDSQGRWACQQIEPVRFVPLLSGVIAA